MGAFAVAVGKVATLPSTDGVDDNADVANCGKPADTYAAAKLESLPIIWLTKVDDNDDDDDW